MTEQLYFTDSYQQTFHATVLGVLEQDGTTALQLDRTCFYPTSGGQPFDTGVLRLAQRQNHNGDLAKNVTPDSECNTGYEVVDVVAGDDGIIHHILEIGNTDDACSDRSPNELHAVLQTWVGLEVTGEITWERRFDHMQQHSGQHLLSQVFYRLFGYETVSVHFGATESTLDLAIEELSPIALTEAEAAANALIYAALPIRAYFVSEAELHTVPLRKAPKVSGQIRIVEIEQYDYSACGGTHCRTTAELGVLKCTKVERRRKQTRVTFLCGQRAYRDYVAKHDLLMEAATLFSNDIGQVPTLIERNLTELKIAQRTINQLEEVVLEQEAKTLLEEAEQYDNYKLVQAIFRERDVSLVKRLTTLLQESPDVVTLFATVDAEKTTLCFGSSLELMPVHMGQLLKKTLEAFGGRGGGKADFAQGGGIAPTEAATALAMAKAELVQQRQQKGLDFHG